MNCQSFQKLTVVERAEFIGELMHLVQSNELEFRKAKHLIEVARSKGKLDRVTINPPELKIPADMPLEQ